MKCILQASNASKLLVLSFQDLSQMFYFQPSMPFSHSAFSIEQGQFQIWSEALASEGHSLLYEESLTKTALSQGWKLFAEAHKIDAGDQVSFELVAPQRMVVQVIRPADLPRVGKVSKRGPKGRPRQGCNIQDPLPTARQQVQEKVAIFDAETK